MEINYLEIAGTILGLLYLYFEYKASVWVWVAGILMPVIYLKVYFDAGLYADFGISIYYIIASVYGLLCWMKSPRRAGENSANYGNIAPTPKKMYLPLIFSTFALWGIIGFILYRFTNSMVPWTDGFTTALSIVAMWMLAKKYLEQWLAWIIADIACACLYVYKDLWFTAALYLLYTIIAVFGYLKWKKEL